MTREELKKVLASRANNLAASAIECIKSNAPLPELERIVESGAADKYYYRDPLHPRSKYRTQHVLDTCFESGFGTIEARTSPPLAGVIPRAVKLGHVPAKESRAVQFAYLLDRGFTPGSNGYRGPLFSAILKSCFYQDPVEAPIAMELARILVAKGKVDIQGFAEKNYEWTGSVEKFNKVLDLGARPSPLMLDCALVYCACAKSPNDPDSGRADVIRALLDSGVSPTKPLGRLGSSQDQLAFLSKHGLTDRIPVRPAILSSPHQPQMSPTSRKSSMFR